MHMLTNNFSLEELTRSQTAVRKDLDNTPTSEVLANLTDLAFALEQVRALLDSPIFVSSGYRSPKVNAAVGGSSSSAHCRGMAADFVAGKFGSPLDVCRKIAASDLEFDQLIFEGNWTHYSIDPRMRRQVLTAHFTGGRVSYVQGLG